MINPELTEQIIRSTKAWKFYQAYTYRSEEEKVQQTLFYSKFKVCG
jgi:hypothetical protein